MFPAKNDFSHTSNPISPASIKRWNLKDKAVEIFFQQEGIYAEITRSGVRTRISQHAITTDLPKKMPLLEKVRAYFENCFPLLTSSAFLHIHYKGLLGGMQEDNEEVDEKASTEDTNSPKKTFSVILGENEKQTLEFSFDSKKVPPTMAHASEDVETAEEGAQVFHMPNQLNGVPISIDHIEKIFSILSDESQFSKLTSNVNSNNFIPLYEIANFLGCESLCNALSYALLITYSPKHRAEAIRYQMQRSQPSGASTPASNSLPSELETITPASEPVEGLTREQAVQIDLMILRLFSSKALPSRLMQFWNMKGGSYATSIDQLEENSFKGFYFLQFWSRLGGLEQKCIEIEKLIREEDSLSLLYCCLSDLNERIPESRDGYGKLKKENFGVQVSEHVSELITKVLEFNNLEKFKLLTEFPRIKACFSLNIMATLKTVQNTDLDLIKFLVQIEAEVHHVSRLHVACTTFNYEVIISCLEKSWNDLFQHADRRKFIITQSHIPNIHYTPLDLLEDGGEFVLLSRIIEHILKKADATVANKLLDWAILSRPLRHHTSLSRESRFDIPTIIQLIQGGADVNFTSPDHHNLLHYAALYGNEKGCQFLIDKKININLQTIKEKKTPLHYAVGNLRIAAMLVEAGADPRTVDSDGFSPYHLACEEVRTYLENRMMKENCTAQ
ncbi:MAG: hypothetical protein K940chlam9_01145 [Chlamydiae bacterium]|nr:hypothetical protein [Chlamydiota bacterium]